MFREYLRYARVMNGAADVIIEEQQGRVAFEMMKKTSNDT
jgi:hypothetical protein